MFKNLKKTDMIGTNFTSNLFKHNNFIVFYGDFYLDGQFFFPISIKHNAGSFELFGNLAPIKYRKYFEQDFYNYTLNQKNNMEIIENSLILGSSGNYYHDLIDFYSKIFSYDNKIDGNIDKVIIGKSYLKDPIIALIEKINIQKKLITINNETKIFKNSYFVSNKNFIKINDFYRHLFLNPNLKFPWQENTENSSLRLKDSSLGLIGVGRIGSAVALKMKNIIGEINFYDPYVSSGYEKVLSANRFESLHSMLSKSDIVSLHTPLNEETLGMVNDVFIKKMRKGSILINTSRGGIIESLDCIYNGIESGNLGAVGLDVLPTEPPDKSLREKLLLSWANQNKISERVIINPHTSYYSPQSYEEMRYKAAKMSLEAMEGNLKRNRII